MEKWPNGEMEKYSNNLEIRCFSDVVAVVVLVNVAYRLRRGTNASVALCNNNGKEIAVEQFGCGSGNGGCDGSGQCNKKMWCLQKQTHTDTAVTSTIAAAISAFFLSKRKFR